MINSNIVDKGPRAPSIQFLPTNLNKWSGKNWEFLSQKLLSQALILPFSERYAITRAGFTIIWHSARGPLSDGETFFGLHLYWAGKCCENLQSDMGFPQCKSDPRNNMVDLLYHF